MGKVTKRLDKFIHIRNVDMVKDIGCNLRHKSVERWAVALRLKTGGIAYAKQFCAGSKLQLRSTGKHHRELIKITKIHVAMV